MTRQTVPLRADDIGSFARALGRQLATAYAAEVRPPGHVELLNMLARSAGHWNYQSLKAAQAPGRAPPAAASAALPMSGLTAPPADGAPALSDTAVRALRLFDADGRLLRWPVKRRVQEMMLWGLWMRFDSSRRYRESEVNDLLNAWHRFGDHCTLRRELVEARLLARRDGGAEYRKQPARPDAETMALMRALRARAVG